MHFPAVITTGGLGDASVTEPPVTVGVDVLALRDALPLMEAQPAQEMESLHAGFTIHSAIAISTSAATAHAIRVNQKSITSTPSDHWNGW